LGREMGRRREMGWGMETADASWDGLTLLKTGVLIDTQTHRHTKVTTVYPPVSLRSLGGYNDVKQR